VPLGCTFYLTLFLCDKINIHNRDDDYISNCYFTYRYRLYGQWKNTTRMSHPRLIRAHTDILEKAKYIMK